MDSWGYLNHVTQLAHYLWSNGSTWQGIVKHKMVVKSTGVLAPEMFSRSTLNNLKVYDYGNTLCNINPIFSVISNHSVTVCIYKIVRSVRIHSKFIFRVNLMKLDIADRNF